MKLSQYVLIYLSVAIVFQLIGGLRISVLEVSAEESMKMNAAVERAADEALYDLVSSDSGGRLKLDKEKAVDKFFLSLWSGLGILDDGYAKEHLYGYFPVMAVTDYDGFYVRYWKQDVGGSGPAEAVWTDKIYYVCEDEYTVCRFERDDTVLLCDKTGMISGEQGGIVRMNYKELSGTEYDTFKKMVPDHYLLSEDAFRARKRRTVTDLIERELRYYTSAHNRIAQYLGIDYEFAFPDDDGSELLRSVPDIAFLAVFQGYPLKRAGGRHYERILLSGSYLDKRKAVD